MTGSVFQLVNAAEGWRLLDNGTPCFWFPERSKTLETACVMADARFTSRGEPAYVQIEGNDGSMQLVASFN